MLSRFPSTFSTLFTNSLQLLLVLTIFTPVLAQDSLDYTDVSTIFNSQCVLCHNGPAAPAGLRLDSYKAITQGSKNGPVAIPGNAADSELMKRIRGQSVPRMPLTGPPFLSAQEIERIEQWIDAGMQQGQAQPAASVKRKVHKPGDEVTYTDVAPVFAQRCIKCHRDSAPGGPPEGLSLQTYERIIRGGDRAVIIPRNAAASEIVRRIRGVAHPKMPFDGPPWLSQQQIQMISDWINQGAKSLDGIAAEPPIGKKVRLEGRLTSRWAVDGAAVIVDGRTRIKKNPQVGSKVRVEGFIGQNGRIHASRIRSR